MGLKDWIRNVFGSAANKGSTSPAAPAFTKASKGAKFENIEIVKEHGHRYLCNGEFQNPNGWRFLITVPAHMKNDAWDIVKSTLDQSFRPQSAFRADTPSQEYPYEGIYIEASSDTPTEKDEKLLGQIHKRLVLKGIIPTSLPSGADLVDIDGSALIKLSISTAESAAKTEQNPYWKRKIDNRFLHCKWEISADGLFHSPNLLKIDTSTIKLMKQELASHRIKFRTDLQEEDYRLIIDPESTHDFKRLYDKVPNFLKLDWRAVETREIYRTENQKGLSGQDQTEVPEKEYEWAARVPTSNMSEEQIARTQSEMSSYGFKTTRQRSDEMGLTLRVSGRTQLAAMEDMMFQGFAEHVQDHKAQLAEMKRIISLSRADLPPSVSGSIDKTEKPVVRPSAKGNHLN